MAEELKSEMRKLENLIGCRKVDITSRSATEEFIEALNLKYKNDVKNSRHLHRLEFYHALIEDARQKKRKAVEVEEDFLLAKEDDDAKEEAKNETEEQPKEKEFEEPEKPDEVVSVSPEDIDEWKNLMTLSKIYYVLEHPMSEGLTWKRRVSKKKQKSKFDDKDLIEWRVAQNFRLKTLEEWALSRSEARKLSDESPYDFNDLLDDNESRELEDMFNILGTQKQNKREVGVLEKALHTKRPFKFKDEGVKDWTESYSDDSEQSDSEQVFCEIPEIEDVEPDLKIVDYKELSIQPSLDEGQDVSEIFSSYREITKYKRPIFEAMEETEDMEDWYDLCHEAVGEGKELSFKPSPPTITIASPEPTTEAEEEYETLEKEQLETIDEDDEEDYELSSLDEDSISKDHERAVKSGIKSMISAARSSASGIVEAGAAQPGKEADGSLEADDNLENVLRKESASKSRIDKNEKKTSRSDENAVEDEVKSIISAAKDIETAKTSKDSEQNGEETADLDSVLRMESVSKRRIDESEEKDEKENMSGGTISTDPENQLKNEIGSIVSKAESPAENLAQETSKPLEGTDSLEQDSNLDSVLRKESASKSKINKKDVKEHTSGGTISTDHENEVKYEIESIVSKAESPAENLAQETSKPLEGTDSLEQDSNLDSVLRKESASKSRINNTEERNVTKNSSDSTINNDHNNPIRNENESLVSKAKPTAENLEEDTNEEHTKPMDESEPLREQDDNLDSALKKESISKIRVDKQEDKTVTETTTLSIKTTTVQKETIEINDEAKSSDANPDQKKQQ